MQSDKVVYRYTDNLYVAGAMCFDNIDNFAKVFCKITYCNPASGVD